MSSLAIHVYGDPILRQKARTIARVEERHQQFARAMAEAMYGARGIGLAANQVGLLERLIVVDVEWSDRKTKADKGLERCPIMMINPEILDESVEDDQTAEGCLSLPEMEGSVWRPSRIRYRYLDLAGRAIEAEATGLLSRCIQHEIDHLDGVLFIDRMAPDAREKLAGKLASLRERAIAL
jgi:peptide deformylase